MQISRSKRKAVAPVLATLMMIAVAVAMSVIIFVWSQGFLAQTSAAAGGQQSQQNLAASSGISIETAIFDTSSKTITIVVRNVGSVAETLGSLQISGVPSNSGFSISDVCVSPTTNAAACTASGSIKLGTAPPIAKAAAVAITYTASNLASGDSINIKVSTTVGTFATQQFTVP
ncbi:MAG: hypothetical protein JRM80_12275 [Nitrososphaerota archaeon]|nr:hypothetical protein [Nitrososphaerota archaeon]